MTPLWAPSVSEPGEGSAYTSSFVWLVRVWKQAGYFIRAVPQSSEQPVVQALFFLANATGWRGVWEARMFSTITQKEAGARI